MSVSIILILDTIWCKIFMGDNIDEFDKFPAIYQCFPHQNFPISYIATYCLRICDDPAQPKIKLYQ